MLPYECISGPTRFLVWRITTVAASSLVVRTERPAQRVTRHYLDFAPLFFTGAQSFRLAQAPPAMAQRYRLATEAWGE